MAYKRKTKDCYAIEGNCGYGWDIECNCEDYADAKAQLKTDEGNWVSTTPDDELGKFVYACLWHPLDHIYHLSDKFKDLFKPGWRKEIKESD